jgi:hypothetical protein
VSPADILQQLRSHGVSVRVENGRLLARPLNAVPPALRDAARQCRAGLVALLQQATPATPSDADAATRLKALAVLTRLKAYIVPQGRMPAARAIVERLRPILNATEFDPAVALHHLEAVERELIAMGGEYDPELAAAIVAVESVFDSNRLVEVKRRVH